MNDGTGAQWETLYDTMGVEIIQHDRDPRRPPNTTYTATIETIDNDRAHAMLGGVPSI